MMTTVLTKFDTTGQYFARVVERPGKRELQIHPLHNEDGEVTISTTLSATFELDSTIPLVSIDWITKEDVTNGRRSKRRSSSSTKKHENTLTYVACSFKNGNIITFSPFQKEAISHIKTSFSIRSVTGGAGKLWAAGATEVLEYDINDSTSANKIQYPKDQKTVTQVQFTTIRGTPHIISIGSKIVLQECSTGKVMGSVSVEGSFGSTACIENALFTSSSEHIRVFSLPELKQIHKIQAKGPVMSIFTVDDTSAGVVLSTGQVQIYKNIFEKLKVLTVRPNTKEVNFTNACFTSSTSLVSWVDIEPKFQTLDINTTEKSIKVDVKHKAQSATKKTAKPLESAFHEIEPREQYKLRDIELAALIAVKVDKVNDLLAVLVSNPEETKIKAVVSQIDEDVTVKLYRALQSRVASDPTESETFNTWLKWIVISHPSTIHALNSFKSVKTSIKKSLKQLPDLLALQGRLELLQSQLSLRSHIGQKSEADQEVDSAVAKAEESIVYVNGENDESDIVDGDVDAEEGVDQVEEEGEESSAGEEEDGDENMEDEE